MRTALLLPVTLAALSGCGLASFDIEIKDDGSGKASLVAVEYESAPLVAAPEVKGVSKAESFRVAAHGEEYTFADVRKLRLGGVDLKWAAPKKGPTTLVVTLDTRATAFWFKRLGITAERVAEGRARARRFLETFAKDPMLAAMAGGKGGDLDKAAAELGSTVTFEIKLAAPMGSRLQVAQLKPKALPAGWEIDTTEPRKAKLKMPADDLLAGKLHAVTLKLTAAAAPDAPRKPTTKGTPAPAAPPR